MLVSYARRAHEAVQRVEIGQSEIDLAVKTLEAAARVARTVLEDGAANFIGRAGLKPLEAGVFAPDALALHHAAAWPCRL